MASFNDVDTGLFTRLAAADDANTAAWMCPCGGCGEGFGGAGGNEAGAYATNPGDNSYIYSAQAPAQGGGTLASLMAGSKWSSLDSATAKTIITFSFVEPGSSQFAYADNNAAFSATASAFSAADRELTRELLAKIEAVCNVQFVEVADDASQCGVLRYGYSQQPTAMGYAGYAFYPSSNAIGGDIWIASAQSTSTWDFYRPNLILHETLHAIGLKHPFSGDSVMAADQDIIPNTVMSYSPVAGASTGYLQSYPSEPMAYDVAALQQLYGAASSGSGDTTYNLAASDFKTFSAIYDTDGTDTLDAAGLGCGVTLNLDGGTASDIGVRINAQGTVSGSKVNVTYAKTLTVLDKVQIENAVGSNFADTINGTAGANRIEGKGGNDVIDGGAGADTAVYAGTLGHFTIAQAGGQTVVRDNSGSEGTDTLLNIERLQFADAKVALDIGGNAGQAARLLGAVFGADAVHNTEYAGVALSLLDGGMGFDAVVGLALDVALGRDRTGAEVVDLLFCNVMGTAPTAGQAQGFVDMLESGQATQVSLVGMAAYLHYNEANIDLAGLAAHGLVYA